MTVWRLTRARYATLDGAGARQYGGRWNRRGHSVVYASEHLSLAVLEILVHLELLVDEFPADYVKIGLNIPATVSIKRMESLPGSDDEMLERGDRWIEAAESAVLLVPSVVVPEEYNILLNPAHADFVKVEHHPAQPFTFDARLPGVLPTPIR
ncbi:MAG: RES domain-containing protein [Candidatus Binataceae bacterium]|nr:RES domain-containing protein [Candidatus Binataceae bacterium]